jgi:VanZ family protein
MHRRAVLGSLCVSVWVGLLAVGWWPFNFIPRNQVTWLSGRNGVAFDGYGQVFSPAHSSLESVRPPVSIEIWLRSTRPRFDYTEIACFGREPVRDLTISQSGPDLVVEGRFQDLDGSFNPRPIFLARAFADTRDHFVTITASSVLTKVYLDANLERSLPPLRVDDLFGGLLIGHSPEMNDPWSGELLGLGMYHRALSAEDVKRHHNLWQAGKPELLASENALALYPANEGRGAVIHNRADSGFDLVIPTKFCRQGKVFLQHSLPLDRPQLVDMSINIAGFIPLGFLLAIWAGSVMRVPRTQSVFFAVLVGALTSFLIEMLQVYLPSRDSSLIDVITNTVGSGCGAVLSFGFPVALTRAAGCMPSLMGDGISRRQHAAERRQRLG